MKKRILALLLAGLMTASFAACQAAGSNDTGDGGTESDQTTESTTEDGSGTVDPEIVWTKKEQTVYTTDTVKFRKDPSSTGETIENIPAKTALQATRVSNTGWCEVTYKETVGYVSSKYVTDVDIVGDSFTPVEGGSKIMYVSTSSLSVRLYPTTESFSEVKDHYKLNDEVKVVATNDKWSKVEYSEGVFYFVNSYYLSDEKAIDINDEKNYTDKFTDCATPLTKYTKGKVNLRKVPHLSGEIETTLENAEVTVLKTGTVSDINWCYVVAQIAPSKEGDAPTIKYGYISASYLADTSDKGTVTLEDILSLYTGFTKLASAKDMYVLETTSSLFARTTPIFEGNKNIGDTLVSKQKIKVVATGIYEGVNCCIIEVTKEEKTVYYFVGSSHLTTNAQGLPTVTLEDLAIKYPAFTTCTPEKVTAGGVVNCYTIPESSKTPAHKLAAGDEVTLVAKETGSPINVWWVVQTEDGAIYFVSNSLFAD